MTLGAFGYASVTGFLNIVLNVTPNPAIGSHTVLRKLATVVTFG